MKKLILGLILTIFLLQTSSGSVFAQTVGSVDPTASSSAIPQDRPDSQAIIGINGSGSGSWQPDAEVTFTGKLAARSQDVLDWLIENYHWSNIGSTNTPFDRLW